MELWNSLPENLCHLDLSLGQFRRARKTHLVLLSLRYLVIFILVCWQYIYLLTYLLTLQKKQLEQYIISCKTVADALRSTVLNTKTSSTSGGKAPWPQTPTIGSRSHARHGCVFDPHFSLPSAAPVYQYITIAARTTMEGQWDMYSTLVTVNPMSLKPETEIRNPGFCRSLTSYYRSHWQ